MIKTMLLSKEQQNTWNNLPIILLLRALKFFYGEFNIIIEDGSIIGITYYIG